jgi:hypothetical protein
MDINVVYFSCGRDEDLLKISLASSKRNYSFNNVYIFSDPNDPVSSDLESEANIVLRKNGSEKLYGLDNIRDMHDCLKIASNGCDYVLKKDSDILDCSDYAYKMLERGQWDCYGAFPMARENLIPDGHFNGNAYFIKPEVIWKFPQEFPEKVHEWRILNYPEDMVTSTICNTITKNIKIDETASFLDGYFVFDVFLTNVASRSADEIKKYGFAHCRGNKRIIEFLNKKIYENN